MKSNIKYFHSSIAVTVLGLLLGFAVGYFYTQSIAGGLKSLFLTAVLAILEISLSFDNAVVNATVLRDMSPKWRHRFITWGILLAVFGMRIVFPLAVVSLAAKVSPWQALLMATFKPDQYAQVMLSAHVALAGFGGAFLLMVALNFFFNAEKEIHWLKGLESFFARLGKVHATAIGLALLLIYVITRFIPDAHEQLTFLTAAVLGLITYVFVDGIGVFLKLPVEGRQHIERASAAMFIYLEVLDASFSFDGVVGAFALTSNLFVIAAGLGIGAMFVRSLTILLVEKETLSEFRYLEHGAFYAIWALAVLMVMDVFIAVPEVITGLIGAVIIGLSLYSSVKKT